MSYMNKGRLISSFLICIPFVVFSSLIALGRTSVHSWKRIVRETSFPDLGGKLLVSHHYV